MIMIMIIIVLLQEQFLFRKKKIEEISVRNQMEYLLSFHSDLSVVDPFEWQWSTSRFVHKVSIQFHSNVSNSVTLFLTCIQSMKHSHALQLLWFCDNICNTHESKLVS